jgi:23S rRNA (uracil1939-C5)-methyltransferase
MAEIIHDLEIKALTHGGRGLGHHRGKVVFVPNVVPGDIVRCQVIKTKSRYTEAQLLDVQQPSESRRKAPCPYFGHCGGCQWQHMSYSTQAYWKETILADLLVRNGVVSRERIDPLVPAPEEWHYRSRAQFKCHQTDDGLAIGFFRQGSHFVVDVDHCHILVPELNDFLEQLRMILPKAPSPDCLPQVDVAWAEGQPPMLVVHVLPKATATIRSWLHQLSFDYQLNCCLQSGRKSTLELVKGSPDLSLVINEPTPMTLQYGPGQFAQINLAQNRVMIARMLELLELQGTERVLDLFCGMGNFSLPLARQSSWVTGIEGFAPSVESARQNADRIGIHNVDFQLADATAFVDTTPPCKGYDLIVLDPPRTGCYALVKSLATVGTERILYISCEPATLARDLKPLVHGGYSVVKTLIFDMFPQTWHIESMTLLKKTDHTA